jgi:hypothetical protein
MSGTLLLGIRLGKQVMQRLVEIQRELFRARRFRLPRRARIWFFRRSVKPMSQETPDSLAGCTLLVFAVAEHGGPIG